MEAVIPSDSLIMRFSACNEIFFKDIITIYTINFWNHFACFIYELCQAYFVDGSVVTRLHCTEQLQHLNWSRYIKLTLVSRAKEAGAQNEIEIDTLVLSCQLHS